VLSVDAKLSPIVQVSLLIGQKAVPCRYGNLCSLAFLLALAKRPQFDASMLQKWREQWLNQQLRQGWPLAATGVTNNKTLAQICCEFPASNKIHVRRLTHHVLLLKDQIPVLSVLGFD